MRAAAVVTALLAVALGAGTAAAQRPHRSGWWIELGSGPAAARVACGGCEDVTVVPGAGGLLRTGGTISDRVLIGVESFGFSHEALSLGGSDTTTDAATATLTLDVLWFPWRAPIFLKGGVGMADGEFTVRDTAGVIQKAEGAGIGLTFGLGADLPLSRRLALTLNAAAFITGIGDVVLLGTRVDDVIATMYHVGLGVTWR